MNPNSIIDRYLEGSADISALLGSLTTDVDECNLALSDLDHFLELEELNEEELAQLQKLRKCTLVSRRKAKDLIRVIDQILPTQIEGRTTQDRYEYAIRNLQARVYTPRKVTLDQALGREDPV